MAPSPYVAPVASSTAVFRDDIFKGKVLFCTGGGSGIGKGMTETVMRHGASAVIIGRNLERLTAASQELSQKTGEVCIPAQADVRKPESLRDAVKKAIERFGRIDFVICGAAGNFLAPISGLSENAFRTVIEIDTIGTYNTVKATLPHIRASKGSYIHISATLHYQGTPYQAHVSSAKAAVDALSRVIAMEEGPHGVRSNVLAPGYTMGTEGLSKLYPKGKNPNDDEKMARPLGRYTEIQDVANATVFLFSDAALYITGQIIPIDGSVVGSSLVPYPQAVLDPASVQKMLKGKL
ncbi:hypothetical protein GYMLUDRAFT_175646 [Collybiopsis luxurians FD-317 M1]|uniref:2,4-dienoyl-CoA reductase [(3E)-enoyl-CoA-producing] n=1 Tax=Collybiopsis luxurians FD-317 M1 TaxID=944289 RepID=A0A0D0CBP2_9AGAR|nr:hypothetical protein GYMLUDRAFT_175646 [Collybiopsis luxurians FD-317 M1]